ncbi:exported hypothetical protein [Burkholderiales bacterium 8X]|nr:exported hypothetical protein [Burkholderiales bacterium 8X]
MDANLRTFVAAALGAVVLAVAGCGGGGDGGGGGGGAPVGGVTPVVAVSPPAAVPAEPEPAKPHLLEVQVAGLLATPDAQGRYEVPSGSMVEITVDREADWQSEQSPGGLVVLQNPRFKSLKWRSELINPSTAPTTYSVIAKSRTEPVGTTRIVLLVAAPKPG